jgi:very-short-patch-repair endonuclease
VHAGAKYDYAETEYRHSNEKVSIICPAHGAFTQTPHHHLKGQGCRSCGHAKRFGTGDLAYNLSWFIERAGAVHGDRYDYSGTEYRGTQEKLRIRCPKHGLFEQRADGHLAGHGCPSCAADRGAGFRSTTQEDFLTRARQVHGDDHFDYSQVEYEAMITKVTIICAVHGAFQQKPHHHVNGHGCPKCREPRGEIQVRKVLTALGLPYVRQWKHPGLRRQLPLAFDFAVPHLKTAIEFDGEQHRRPIRFGSMTEEHAANQFKTVQERDAAKNRWADEHGWTLIRLTDPATVSEELRAHLGHHTANLEGVRA